VAGWSATTRRRAVLPALVQRPARPRGVSEPVRGPPVTRLSPMRGTRRYRPRGARGSSRRSMRGTRRGPPWNGQTGRPIGSALPAAGQACGRGRAARGTRTGVARPSGP
jgi:hypothetical protein